uniref:Pentatricopeptide repeat-containing protein n=1 Tax=Kalanchoe fedtschenkoi TaxID=63787 RepID=A0A7N0URU1_KALFE
MALRSICRALILNRANGAGARLSYRGLSSGAVTSDYVEDASDGGEAADEVADDLKSRILRLRLPKRSATNVIQKWVSEGNGVTDSQLRDISKELRRCQRYKHALEISEWMVGHEEFQLSDSDYAVRIELMTKVFGIDASERYFEALPDAAKTSETYTALLHSYGLAKQVDKAEQIYQRIKESNVPVTALAYNEMMTLYMSVGEAEKVSSVVEDLKHQKVEPDLFTYNLWISSYAVTMNVDGVKRILDEMTEDCGSKDNWLRYANLAKIYITTGSFTNSESNSVVETEKGITQREWITYDFLILLHAGLGNKEKLAQIWKSLRMTKQKMTSRNYTSILSSYLLLGQSKDVADIIDQWKESPATEFSIPALKKLYASLEELSLTKEADTLHMLLMQKGHSLDEKSSDK